jgi:hypothetical protein
VKKYGEFGAAWKHIASFFKSRTDINVKSRWQLMQRRVRKNSGRQMVQNALPRPLPAVPKPLPIPIVSCDPLPFAAARPAQVASAAPAAADNPMDQIWGSLMMNEETPFESSFDFWF